MNLKCLLPNRYIAITHWAPHPCGGYYMHHASCWGREGEVGWWVP